MQTPSTGTPTYDNIKINGITLKLTAENGVTKYFLFSRLAMVDLDSVKSVCQGFNSRF
jgi:hypothetical protein